MEDLRKYNESNYYSRTIFMTAVTLTIEVLTFAVMMMIFG